MCNFNLSCSVFDGTCECELNQSSPEKPFAIQFPISNRNDFYLSSVIQLVTRQQHLIQNISQNMSVIQSKLSLLTPQNDELTTPSQLLLTLTGPEASYPYVLRLIDPIPKPVYKERAFSFSVDVVDSSGKNIIFMESLILDIFLYTADNPSKRVEISTAGEKIIRFICENFDGTLLKFRKVCVQEVTSHYRNGSLLLVVTCKNNRLVKPLIIEDFIVKARKIPSKKLEKK